MKLWTPKEKSLLRKHYRSGGFRAVKDLLPERSAAAIHSMAQKLEVHSGLVGAQVTMVEINKLRRQLKDCQEKMNDNPK